MTDTPAFYFDTATVVYQGARAYQEDCLAADFPFGHANGFCILSDGMGGHGSGDIASNLIVSEAFGKIRAGLPELKDKDSARLDLLSQAGEAANDRIKHHIEQDDDTKGMGATLLMALIDDERLFWWSAGDSILLLLRDGALRQLNEDHSMAPQIDIMIKAGAMSEEVGKSHPDRNILTSALRGKPIEKVDMPKKALGLRPGDILVVSSDGLQTLSNETIAQVLQRNADRVATVIARALLTELKAANAPEQDNASFAVIRIEDPDDEGKTGNIDDMPVLAVADVLNDTKEEAQEERKFYWYRGQKYYKD